VAGDCNEGCQNQATGLRAEFCLGNPFGAPSPSATPASENVHALRGHHARYVHFLEPAITYGGDRWFLPHYVNAARLDRKDWSPSSAKLAATGEVQRSHGDLLRRLTQDEKGAVHRNT
jgi:hypothetical protein